ncbi:hypothetical protein ACIRP7_19820 [Streptomyces sp. NPDC102270]|uniref:putative antirestriction adenine methyltransferase n=1 Tax=Streptomyces sp. NPDC102270 TaxID=3366150 RepID=UPI00382B38FA
MYHTGIVGTHVSGGDPQAAHLLYVHWLARMQAKPEVGYWTNLVTDMVEREDEHKARLAGSLQQIGERLPGVSFTPKCMWDHLAEAEDDPHAIIIAAPPTCKAGFERFFDICGRIEWAEPKYAVFDPGVDMQRPADHMRDKAALLMFLQEERSGRGNIPDAHPRDDALRGIHPPCSARPSPGG